MEEELGERKRERDMGRIWQVFTCTLVQAGCVGVYCVCVLLVEKHMVYTFHDCVCLRHVTVHPLSLSFFQSLSHTHRHTHTHTHTHTLSLSLGNFLGLEFCGGSGGGFERFTDWRGSLRNFMTVPRGGVGWARQGGRIK